MGVMEHINIRLRQIGVEKKREPQVHHFAGTQPPHALPVLRSQECDDTQLRPE